jgi:nitrile hydratase
MNGIHDMGGMHGFGAVVREEHEPVFHEPWEGRVWAMLRQLSTKYPPPPGAGRDIIEHIEAARYLSIGYYEKFLQVLAKRAVAEGIVTDGELDERMQEIKTTGHDPVPRVRTPEAATQAVTRLKTSQPHSAQEGSPPRFARGDLVLAGNLNWPGHNRLPRYIRGKRSIVERVNGLHFIEDAHAEALGPNPQTVYTVRFDAGEVWGAECELNLRIFLRRCRARTANSRSTRSGRAAPWGWRSPSTSRGRTRGVTSATSSWLRLLPRTPPMKGPATTSASWLVRAARAQETARIARGAGRAHRRVRLGRAGRLRRARRPRPPHPLAARATGHEREPILLGDRDWYHPGWLAWLPDFRVEGRSADAAPPVLVPAGD